MSKSREDCGPPGDHDRIAFMQLRDAHYADFGKGRSMLPIMNQVAFPPVRTISFMLGIN